MAKKEVIFRKAEVDPIKLIVLFIIVGIVAATILFANNKFIGKEFGFLDNLLGKQTDEFESASAAFLPFEVGELQAMHFNNECWYCGTLKSSAGSEYCTGDCCRGACPSDAKILDVPYYNQCGLGTQRYCRTACGPVSVKMGLSYYGTEVSLSNLYSDIGTTRSGSSLEGISSIADEYGVVSKEVTYSNAKNAWNSMQEQIQKGFPLIILVKIIPMKETCTSIEGHYILVVGASDDFVIVNDPYTGRCSHEVGNHLVMSKDYLLDIWKSRGYHAVLLERSGGEV